MEEIGSDKSKGSLRSVFLWGLVLFVVLLITLAILAWLAGDVRLPMQYEGFD